MIDRASGSERNQLLASPGAFVIGISWRWRIFEMTRIWDRIGWDGMGEIAGEEEGEEEGELLLGFIHHSLTPTQSQKDLSKPK